jgi:peptide-methionine (R)-S-oxide reductase
MSEKTQKIQNDDRERAQRGASVIRKTDEQWREELPPEAFEVLRNAATERPFTGELLHNKDTGMYQCAGCGADLFSSDTKFDSGSGWPSFYDVASSENVETHEDRSMGMVRTEVTCARCGGHLGHVFPDGPNPTGLRYCINSCALNFEKQ